LAKQVPVQSPIPIIAIGLTWLLYALIFPLYGVLQYLICAALSAGVFFIARKVVPVKLITLPDAPVLLARSGDAAADKLISDGQAMLQRIHTLYETLPDDDVKAALTDIESIAGQIFAALAKQPAKAGQLRRFMTYYMPTTLKLAGVYGELTGRGVSDEEAKQTMKRIGDALSLVSEAFHKQLSSLYASEVLDASTDMDVLESMLARDGLSGKPALQSLNDQAP